MPIAIATMTRARTDAEAEGLLSALAVLTQREHPVFVSDGGSFDSFLSEASRLPGICVVRSGHSLVDQVKLSIQAALESGAETIVYTEPDKQSFFANGLAGLIAVAQRPSADAVVAARDEQSMLTFPQGQQNVERIFNTLAGQYLGVQGDFLYGPIMFREHLILRYFGEIASDLGWGWRPYVLARCIRGGGSVCFFEGSFSCPDHQQSEDTEPHRLYRLRQFTENVRGLYEGLSS